MTKDGNPAKVVGAVPQRSPEALRRLGRAVIRLARWQLDHTPSAPEPTTLKSPRRPSSTTAVPSTQKRPLGGGKP